MTRYAVTQATNELRVAVQKLHDDAAFGSHTLVARRERFKMSWRVAETPFDMWLVHWMHRYDRAVERWTSSHERIILNALMVEAIAIQLQRKCEALTK